MAFDLIAVRQSKPFTVSGEDGSIEVAFDPCSAASLGLSNLDATVSSCLPSATAAVEARPEYHYIKTTTGRIAR